MKTHGLRNVEKALTTPSAKTAAAAILFMLMMPIGHADDTISGLAIGIDGDTISVGTHMRLHVRLEGIAAPETYQPGGRAAQARMHELVDGQLVTCSIPRAEESHDRLVGTCRLQDGRDLGGVMTGEGLARDCFAYSHGRYAATQAPAATALTLPSYCHEERRK